MLAFFLEKYPDQSVCLFVGLIGGMLPSLLREAGEQGRTKGSWISTGVAFVLVLSLLLSLNVLSVTILPALDGTCSADSAWPCPSSPPA